MNDKTLDKLNKIYESHKDNCTGSFHNALWQIMINNSCSGAFTYIHSTGQVGIAQRDGGYIPASFDIPDAAQRDTILDDLNREVFGLLPDGVLDVEMESLRNSARHARG